MVNECVGPDGDGCTAKAVTPAKYGTQSRDGGKLCRACYGKKYQRNKRKRAESPIPTSYNSSRHVEFMHSTARTVALLESPQDREATIKTLLMFLGCRCAACVILSRSPASFFSRLLCASVLIIRLRASGAATRTIFRTRRTRGPTSGTCPRRDRGGVPDLRPLRTSRPT